MCGICGITEHNPETVRTMSGSLAHRGPDGSDTYIDEGISLAHRRLAIIDLDSRSNQPMLSADGRYVIVFNGELYNYRELRCELADYPFKTESDTEVLLAAFAKWGTEVFPKLKGIFAFAIWDKKEQLLLLARDHMGVKPLYYSIDQGVLAFASELTAFAPTHQQLDHESVTLYLSLGYVPGPMTMLKGVRKLLPGHYLKYQHGKEDLVEYFNTYTGGGQPVSGGSIYETIDQAVERQLVSDRPVGVFLSGGLDSSIVLHHMRQHSEAVRSFSVKFEMVPGAESAAERFNADAALAARTAAHYGTEHTTFTITLNDVRQNLLTVAESLDEPVANATGLSQFLLSKWVRESGVVVALGGDGGDELFGGYTRHRAMMAAYWYQQLPRFLQKLGGTLHPRAKKLSIPVGMPLHIALMATKDELITRITKRPFSGHAAATAYFRELYDKAPENMHPLDIFMRADRRTWLAEESLLRSDRSSMAHGLELRVPLLDLDVVRLADTISVYEKTTPFSGKNVLRKAYQSHLPEYLFKQPKRGWISPSAKWLRDPEINTMLQEVLSSSYYSGLDEFFDWKSVRQMMHEHTKEGGYYLQPLWNVLVIQCWAKKHNLKY